MGRRGPLICAPSSSWTSAVAVARVRERDGREEREEVWVDGARRERPSGEAKASILENERDGGVGLPNEMCDGCSGCKIIVKGVYTDGELKLASQIKVLTVMII